MYSTSTLSLSYHSSMSGFLQGSPLLGYLSLCSHIIFQRSPPHHYSHLNELTTLTLSHSFIFFIGLITTQHSSWIYFLLPSSRVDCKFPEGRIIMYVVHCSMSFQNSVFYRLSIQYICIYLCHKQYKHLALENELSFPGTEKMTEGISSKLS